MPNFVYRRNLSRPKTYGEEDGNWDETERRTGQGWNDIVADIVVRTGTNAPPLTNLMGGLYLYEFLAGQNYECFANFHVRHDYVLGSMIYPHIHFTVGDNAGGVIRWGFEYTQAQRFDDSGNTVFPATQTLYLDFTVPPNSMHKHFVAEMPEGFGIPGTNIDFDAMIMMRIFRDGTSTHDTLAGSAFGITVDLHYQRDRDTTPFRAPPFI